MREMYCERGVAFIVAPATGDGFNNNQMFCFVFFFFRGTKVQFYFYVMCTFINYYVGSDRVRHGLPSNNLPSGEMYTWRKKGWHVVLFFRYLWNVRGGSTSAVWEGLPS